MQSSEHFASETRVAFMSSMTHFDGRWASPMPSAAYLTAILAGQQCEYVNVP